MKKKPLKTELKISIGILLFYVLWALGWFFYSSFFKGSLQAPYTPLPNFKEELIPPLTQGFLLGTDIFGRSLLETLSAGLLHSFGLSTLVSFFSLAIGLLAGRLSTSGTPIIKIPVDLFINLIFIFPSILIAILFMSFIGKSFWGLFFVLTFTGWPTYAKITRVEIGRIKNLAYVEASRAAGASQLRLFFSIVLPSVLPILLVHLILGMSGVIISEASLGFLGLGGSEYSFGQGISMAKSVLLEAPSLTLIFTFTLAGLILGINLLGDGLRDYLDPQKNKAENV